MPPRPGDIVDLDIDHPRLRRAGRRAPRRTSSSSCAAPSPGDRVRARVTKRKQSHAEARVARDPRPLARAASPPVCAHSRRMRRLRVADARLRRAARVQAAPGRRVAGAHRPPRGLRARAHPRHGRPLALPQQDGVLVRRRTTTAARARPAPARLVERDRRDLATAASPRRASTRARQAVADACRALGLRTVRPRATTTGSCATSWSARAAQRRPAAEPLRRRARFPRRPSWRERVARRLRLHLVRRSPSTPAGRRRRRRRPPHAARAAVPARAPRRRRPRGAGRRLPADQQRDVRDRSTRRRSSFAAPDPARPAVDLYCGIGSLSLPLARLARRVQAVEIQEEAIVAARVNAALNGIDNVDFYAGDVRPLLKFPPHPTLDAERDDDVERPAVVVVDPPRAGLARKALQRAAALGRRPLRLRLLQPDDAGRQRRRARRARLSPDARGAGRHVPADAPHRDGRAVRAPTS